MFPSLLDTVLLLSHFLFLPFPGRSIRITLSAHNDQNLLFPQTHLWRAAPAAMTKLWHRSCWFWMLAHTLLQWLTELRAEAANVKVGIIPKHFAPSSKSQIKLETLSSVNLIWSVCVSFGVWFYWVKQTGNSVRSKTVFLLSTLKLPACGDLT